MFALAEIIGRQQQEGAKDGNEDAPSLLAEHILCAEVDRGALGHGRPGGQGDAAVGRPEALIGARQHHGLGDELRLGLADEGVFIDSEEDGAEEGQSGDEDEGHQQDRAQPQQRPVAFQEVLAAPDQAPPPRQVPIR